jgi:hypothetical protein
VSHKNHPDCEFTSKAACDKAQQIALGQCRAMVDDKDPHPCSRWAISETGWCGQHHASEVERALQTERRTAKRVELDARISDHMAWVATHPSVWDTREISR